MRGASGSSRIARPNGDAVLERQWHLAVERASRLSPRPRPSRQVPNEVAAVVDDLVHRMEAADPRRWARPSGPADRAVLQAIALVCLTVGKREVALTVRRLALLTGRSHDAAARAVRRLVADGWIAVVTEADGEHSRARVLTIASHHACPPDRHHMCAVPSPGDGSDTRANTPHTHQHLREAVDLLGAPIWERLGHHTARTFQALQRGASDIAELVKATGYRPRTVRIHLTRLQTAHLASTRGSAWEACSSGAAWKARPDRAIARQVSYAVDRACHRWWIDELRWMRAPRHEKALRTRGRPARDRYPRRASGKPDHGAARAALVSRIDGAALWRAAVAEARKAGNSVLRHLPNAALVAPQMAPLALLSQRPRLCSQSRGL